MGQCEHMKLAKNAIYWVGLSSEPLFQGNVSLAVFCCNENKFDVERVEITCEDAECIYSFALRRADLGYVGECTTWTLNTHLLVGQQSVSCALINVTDGSASLLSGSPMKAHDRNDLYWMIRVKNVTRELKRN